MKFNDYRNADISVLAEEVLREVPEQIVGYMLMNNIKPQPIEQEMVDPQSY